MFRFHLQSILDLSKNELERAEAEELRLRAEVSAAERAINLLRDAYIADREELNGRLAASEFKDVQLLGISLESKKDQIMERLRGLAALRAVLAAAVQRSLMLRKKTAGLERLRDKRRNDYDLRQERRLQSEVDTRAAQQVWLRKRDREIA